MGSRIEGKRTGNLRIAGIVGVDVEDAEDVVDVEDNVNEEAVEDVVNEEVVGSTEDDY
eukprot:CAMPEP_0205833858 /NCGR_PEP_ID=MMETSP0206-20130828/50333_1 /ASSEMBLY_ACC=CAM_ASM_000279 /TAXON_ID=36767 /ORGANISM="Euplotes focardii, Strain TN1" /LENGTH=57 /DNA_ID=CAMNT_0053140591 /DNA_START=662 /DNA_END=835 /DNA_ORIENTATION=-